MRTLALLLACALPVAAQTTRITSGDSTNRNGGLVGWWPMEDGAVKDQASTNNGTINGGVVIVDGILGRCLSFANSTNQFVQVPNPANLYNITNFTAAFWCYLTKFPATNNGCMMGSHGTGANGNGWYANVFYTPGYSPRWSFTVPAVTNKQVFSPSPPDLFRWTHVVATQSRGLLTLYINGSAVTNNPNSNTGTAPTGNLYIGRFATAIQPWVGSLDDARIYNRALTAGEISALYNSKRTVYGEGN